MAAASDKAPDSAEQLRRRANRRLLGASILLVIAIIAVPMFLEREPPPLPDNVDVRIPPVEGSKFEPKFPDGKKAAEKPAEITAITEPTGAQAGSPATAAPVPALPSPASTAAAAPASSASAAAAKGPDRPADRAADKPAAKPEAPAAAAAAAEKATPKPAAPNGDAATAERKPGQLVVQIIAVRDPATAKATFDRARGMKFPVYTEKIDVANGIVTRVRVGPYNNKQQAEAARAKLAQAGFEAKVLTLQ
ncbi:MAG: SPOR domain-containing protein [Burkholderiales bacterium]|nr:SPOR domain-containing protein [Burkholderiales bacterium]